MRLKSPTFLIFSIAAVWFIFLFICKCIHFLNCDYTSDLFTHLQISRDWLLGKPLFYENCYGHHNLLHNYFFDLLLAPFTYTLNAYGIFVVMFAMMIGAMYASLRTLQRQGASLRAQMIWFFFVCCPATWFVLHDEHYGFHLEIMLLPLCLLFVSAQAQQSRWRFL